MFKFLFGRITLYFGIALIASTILGGAYWGWKKQIQLQALTEYNQKQLELVMKQEQIFREKMAAIEATQQEIVNDLKKKNRELAVELIDIRRYLNSPEVKEIDRPASEIIKNTIRKLGE